MKAKVFFAFVFLWFGKILAQHWPMGYNSGIHFQGDSVVGFHSNIFNAIDKIKKALTGFNIQESFALIYPIYMEAMETDHEMTMHSIAHLILEASQAEGCPLEE